MSISAPRWIVLAALLVHAACASVGRGEVFDAGLDDEIVGDVVAPPVPRGTRLGWDGPAEDDEPWTEAGEIPRLLAPDGGSLPLRLTDVHADVRGHIADVVVTQRFVNDRDTPIEVVYTFPLPENAAVTDMRMVIGERVIESVVRKRDEARQEYAAAREQGHTAALLEQERPNVFTQSVANIEAGATIDVEIHYLQTLSFDSGTFELVFPMVVGPRYMPGRAKGGVPSGTGTHADTDRVPDASRISPPIVDPGMRAGDDIAIAVDIDAGGPIADYRAATHGIAAREDGERLHVELARADERPNRDFVLRWRPAPTEVRSTLFVGPRGKNGVGHFELLVVPPAIDVDARIGRREFIFVLDVSGSMSGEPLALEKMLMRKALADLRPVDTFDVVTFESGTRRLFDRPQPANAARIDEALRFVDGLQAGGGTEMIAGAQLALGDAVAKGRTRYVLFMTDGYIGDEAEIFAAARQLVQRQAKAHRVARVFAVGIGSSPNHHLVKGLARAGAGMAMSVSRRDDPEAALARMQHVIDAAILDRVEVDWKGARIESMIPRQLPDLFASHLLVVHGRYRGAMPTTGIELRARTGGRGVTLPVEVVHSSEQDRVLARLWARERIAELEERLWAADDPRARKAIENLGLQHHLVTQYTSLVAVDRTRRVDEKATTVVQPTNAPEGVDVEMAGGVPYTGPIAGGSNEAMHRLLRVNAAPVRQGASVGAVVDVEEFRNIPAGSSGSRDFTAVVESSSTATFVSGGISLAGTTGAESRYTIEGASVNNPRFGIVGASIVQDFLEEVEVQEAGYEAEYGDASGGQIEARRISGSNAFRGVARFSYSPRLAKPRFITGTDEAVRAIDVTDYGMQAALVMSGPIVRDRLFWTGGAVITGTRSSILQSFHAIGSGKIAEQRFKTGSVDLQLVAGLDWAISPRHELKFTALVGPGFDRRSFRRPAPMSGAPAPLGGASRIANGLVDGQLGWDRSNSTIATLGYSGRVAGDRLEIDARLAYSQFADIEAWRLDHPEIRNQVATQEFDAAGASLFDLMERDERLGRVPAVAAACDDAEQPGDGCPVRQWMSGGIGQYSQTRQRRVNGSVALTHFLNGAGAHQLKYGAQIDHLEDVTDTRYSGRNGADFSDRSRIQGCGEGRGPGEYCFDPASGEYIVDNADRVDNHRFVFADAGDPDARTTMGYGRIRRERGDLGAITTPLGAGVRVDAYRAKVSTQSYSIFLQDKWAILSNLFVSAGVRWELQDIRDALGRRGVLLWDNVAPRIGISYDWTDEGRSRLFASYGWFYQPLPLQLASRVFGGLVNLQRSYRNSDCVGQQVPVDGELRDKVVGNQPTEYCADADAGTGHLAAGAVVPRLKGQFNHQFQIGYEHEVIEDLILGVRWLHSDLGRAVEDVSTNGGLDFILANPGVGVSDEDLRKISNRCAELQDSLDTTGLDDPSRSGIARDLARCEFTADAFAKIHRFAKPRRSFDAVTFEARKRFARNWLVLASYTYSRLVGNYEGFVDPLTGSIDFGASTQYDLPELVRNSFGPLSYNTPHRLRVDGFYTFDLQEVGRLTLGTSLHYQTGYPISLRAGHQRYPGLFPVYLLPRGAGGRVEGNYSWNLSLSYAYPLPGDMELDLAIRIFNVTNARTALRVDEVYSTDNTRPVGGGDLSDLKHTKVQDAGDPTGFFERTIVSPQGNYGTRARFQNPTSAQFELQLRF